MTLTSPQIVANWMRGETGDPQPAGGFWKYTHSNGQTMFAVFMSDAANDLHQAPNVADYWLLKQNDMLTEAGRELLEAYPSDFDS